MATVRVWTVVAAEPGEVWADLREIERHVEWMSDAESIRFLTEATGGVGARFECDTRVGPLRLTDRMEVTEWRPGQAMGIRHDGLVKGSGQFRLIPGAADDGSPQTRFEWSETLRFPWWMGGPVGAALAGPILRVVWRRNLRSFAGRFD